MAQQSTARQISTKTVLREAFREVDLGSYEADAVRPLVYLARLNRNLNHHTITSTLEHIDRESGPRFAASRALLAEAEEKEAVRIARLQREHRTTEQWKEMGLDQRISVVHLPTFFRYLFMVFLAGLDFMVFARALAVVQDVDASARNPEFWLGGAIGLFVSAVAYFLGHAAKRWAMASAQLELGRELIAKAQVRGTPLDDLPRRSTPDKPLTIGLALLFFLALAFTALMRFEAAAGDQNIAVIAFQLLIPVLIVVLEYAAYDPLKHVKVEPTKSVAALRRRASQDQADLEATVARMEKTIGVTNATVGEIRDRAVSRLKRHALEVDDAVMAEVTHVIDTDSSVPTERQLAELSGRVAAAVDRWLRADVQAAVA